MLLYAVMVVNKAIVVIINKYILIREYLTSKSYLTDNAANITNVNIVAKIAENRNKLSSISSGDKIVDAAIGIEVESPTIIDNEFIADKVCICAK